MPEVRAETPRGATRTPLEDLNNFSLVSGGLLYRLWRRTRLSGDALEWTRRRVLATALVTWVPLLLLAIAEGNAWGGSGAVTFLQDVETHVRLLIAAPLLILAEVRVHRLLSRIVQLFVECGLIPDPARSRFDAAVASAVRLRNSVVPELLLIVFVYGVGLPFVWRDRIALHVTSWAAIVEGGRLHPTLAGWWAGLVSMSIFQFLVLRWFFRLFLWARFLWQVSRTKLNLEPTHPDGTAGLLFLARSGRAYNVLLLAIFGPLLVFTPQLRAARRRGMEEYGALGQQYAREFNRKWLGGGRPDEPLLGSADIQSLADLRNGYQVVENIRQMPFGTKQLTAMGATMLLPIAPLLLTTFSVEQLLERVLKALF